MAPPLKKRRVEAQQQEEAVAPDASTYAAAPPPATAAVRDHVLLPYRAVGSVVGPVAPGFFTAGKDSFALCAVGKYVVVVCGTPATPRHTHTHTPTSLFLQHRTLHEYNLARLTLTHVSPAFPKKVKSTTTTLCTLLTPVPHPTLQIRAVAKCGYLNFAAAGGVIYALKVRRLLWSAPHSTHAKVTQLIARDGVLLSLGTDNVVKVWETRTGRLLNEFQPRHDVTPTRMACVANYGNKVVLGTLQGKLELWNFNTGSLVHTFDGFGAAVTSLATAPADDTLGVGLADGRVVCYNLAYAKELMSFRHAEAAGRRVSVTALSFRTDGPQTLASATDAGEIAVWSLAKKKLEGLLTANLQAASHDEVFEQPHTGRVTSVHFLPSEPVLVTAGEDNSMKMYVFDSLQGTGKLLRERRGHHDSCTGVRFFDGRLLLSWGRDRSLRASHVFTDVFNREMSQGPLVKEAKKRGAQTFDLKLPDVTCLASSLNRTHDWGSVVTGHKGSGEARTWRMDNFTVTASAKKQAGGGKASKKNSGASVLKSPDVRDANAEVTAVAVSQCANYGIIGLSTGRVHVFNLQSGNYQGFYEDFEEVREGRAHDGRILALHMLQDNDLLLTVGADYNHKLWSFPPANAEGVLEGAGRRGELSYLRYRILSELLPSVTSFHEANNLLAVGGCPGRRGAGGAVQRSAQRISVFDCTPRSIEEGVRAAIGDEVSRQAKRRVRGDATRVVSARVVREFNGGHDNAVTALAFSTDCRMLFSASVDAIVCVWDVPTTRLIDVIRFPSPVTSFSFHPESHFLATTHTNDSNVYLWTNKIKYGHIPTPVDPTAAAASSSADASFNSISSATPLFAMPEVTADGRIADGDDDADEGVDDEEVKLFDPENPGINLQPEEQTEAEKRLVSLIEEGDQPTVVSLSKAARSKWQTLVSLDVIKKRNKPTAPPKKIDAPFFLPSTTPDSAGSKNAGQSHLAGGSRLMTSLKDETAAAAEEDEAAAAARAKAALADATLTPFLRALAAEPADHDAALHVLEEVGASKADLEFRNLVDTYFMEADAPEGEGEDPLEAETRRRLLLVASFFEHHLARRNSFEYVQACLAVFLRHCGLHAVRHEGVAAHLTRIAALQADNTELLSSLVDNTLCLIRHFVSPV